MFDRNSMLEQIQPQLLKLSLIKLDEGIQPRQQLNQGVIATYAEAMHRGDEFPPIIVFFDGNNYWLADGFHRVKAKKSIGERKILAEVQSGSRRDSILYAVGAESLQGLPRTNGDKNRVVRRLLLDPEWSQWSDSAIAERCRVSRTLVGRIRQNKVDLSPRQVNLSQRI